MTKLQEIQKILGVKPDDAFGSVTEKAFEDEVKASRERRQKEDSGAVVDGVDERSARNILTLHPKVRPIMEALIIEARNRGWKFKVTSAYRTYAEQNYLYEQGRSRPGRKVTNARGGYSNHNFGIAADVTLFADDDRTPIYESTLYSKLGPIGEKLGLSWGGRWSNPVDKPHYALRPSWAKNLSEKDMITDLRMRKQDGEDAFA